MTALNSKHNKILKLLAFAIFGLLFATLFYRQIIASSFDLMLGNADAKFNGIITEHWWKVLQGKSDWLSPGFFYPIKGALGFSDAGFLNAFPYMILRSFGIDPLTSYQITLFLLVFIGWWGMIFILNNIFELDIIPVITGAFLFTFPNLMAMSVTHTQLFAVYYIPYIAIGSYYFIKYLNINKRRSFFLGAFLAFVIPSLFYTSYYIGWFFIFYLLIIMLIFFLFKVGKKYKFNISNVVVRNRKAFLTVFILTILFFIPFIITYLPALKEFGNRDFKTITLPSIIDFMNVGTENLIWGKLLHSVYPDINARPQAWELPKGIPLLLMLSFLGIATFFFTELKKRKQFVLKKNLSKNQLFSIIGLILSLGVFFSWILMVKINGCSLWWLVAKLVPGAGSLRAVFRFQHILIFPIAIIIAFGLQIIISRFNANKKYSRIFIILFSIYLAFLFLEEFNKKRLVTYSKKDFFKRCNLIDSSPNKAKLFALLPYHKSNVYKRSDDYQVDAMFLAQKYNLKTINGYSGQFPYQWGLLTIKPVRYKAYLIRWIDHYRLASDNLYFLDINKGKWYSAREYYNPLKKQMSLMVGPLDKKDYASKLHIFNLLDTLDKKSRIDFILKIENRGNAIFSSYSLNWESINKYAVFVSYRWKNLKTSKYLSGFVTRTKLPTAIFPDNEISMNMQIVTPNKSGRYILEIELVQERAGWFKDKGFPGVKKQVYIKCD